MAAAILFRPRGRLGFFFHFLKTAMAARQTKAPKRPAPADPTQGPSSAGTSKKSKKASSSKEEEKASAARAKEELRLHQAIERSIQKAIKEASIKELASPPDPGTSRPGPTSTAPSVPVPPMVLENSSQALPPLSPDGGGYVPPFRGKFGKPFLGPNLSPLHPGPPIRLLIRPWSLLLRKSLGMQLLRAPISRQI